MLKKKHTIYSYIDQGLIEGVTNESLWESTQAGTIPIPIPTPMAIQRKRIANQRLVGIVANAPNPHPIHWREGQIGVGVGIGIGIEGRRDGIWTREAGCVPRSH